MVFKLIVLFAAFSSFQTQVNSLHQCSLPYLNNGKIRSRQRFRSFMIKYICNSGFELVGNMYSFCKNGEWDTQKPVCVKPGCELPIVDNGISIPSRQNAWVVYFCLPGYQLQGSSAIYCDGRKWNTTAPTCINTSSSTKTTCDFESSDLCGWKQDALHDFDWERLNKRVTQIVMNTGPSFDHTFGEGQNGYYMYIDSSSSYENSTARLLSPIYDRSLVTDGCFTIFYHMYGRNVGALRVFQKPDSLGLEVMLGLNNNELQKYLLFEQWGNQGDKWYGNVSSLRDFSDDFQIVIEGIRGGSVVSNIAIDDVGIYHGEDCKRMRKEVPTPPDIWTDSCVGRCGKTDPQQCGCYATCIFNDNCCADFFDRCVYNSDDDAVNGSTTAEMPQTQKLVNKSTVTVTTTITTTTTTKPTIKQTTTKPTTLKIVKIKSTSPPKVTIFQKDEIKDTEKDNPKITTNKAITTPKIKTTKSTKTTKIAQATTTKQPTIKIVKTTTAITKQDTVLGKSDHATDKSKININRSAQSPVERESGNSLWKPLLISVVVFACVLCLARGAASLRGARGRAALDYFRGRTRNDQEVRYLNSSDGDETNY